MEYEIAEMTGGSQWAAAYQKAKALVSQMTLEEKVLTRMSPRDEIPLADQVGILGKCYRGRRSKNGLLR